MFFIFGTTMLFGMRGENKGFSGTAMLFGLRGENKGFSGTIGD